MHSGMHTKRKEEGSGDRRASDRRLGSQLKCSAAVDSYALEGVMSQLCVHVG